jgi:hypothetical protein
MKSVGNLTFFELACEHYFSPVSFPTAGAAEVVAGVWGS